MKSKKIENKQGAVNKIIYDNTVYHNGEYHFYPSIPELFYLAREIISCNETTKYVRFIPFFHGREIQVEFDDYMCFIECKNNVDEKTYSDFISECKIESESFADAQKHYCLCNCGDVAEFQNALKNYLSYLDEIIPRLAEILKTEYNFNDEDFLYGYFCFEINSE